VPSYSPVFSQGFIYYTEATPNESFLVPAGFTAVVRECDLYLSEAEVAAWVGLNFDAGGGNLWFWYASGISVASSQPWRGRVVVPGGASIVVDVAALGVSDSLYVGGYLLRNSLS
jgi:hypothetical protein